jgi:threonine-phosphate decarboxylase
LGLSPSQILDYSANINPLGPPPGLWPALEEARDLLVHYPDPGCGRLRADLAAHHGLEPERILVGNGSTELIFLLARALRPARALVVAPAFSEYQAALDAEGARLDFQVTQEADGYTLAAPLDPQGADLVFVANPASPSGVALEPTRLLELARPVFEAGARLVVDEAFVDFCPQFSLLPYLADHPGLIIMRSFTKFYAIPGLRLGYLLAEPGLLADLAKRQEPWSVGSLAQAAGSACLAEDDYVERSREVVAREREFLSQGLAALGGMKVFPSQANYLLVKLSKPGARAANLRAALEPQGILIRDASNFVGLDQAHVRLAVRGHADNERLLAALGRALAVM